MSVTTATLIVQRTTYWQQIDSLSSENDERVFGQAGLLEGLHQLADEMVFLHAGLRSCFAVLS